MPPLCIAGLYRCSIPKFPPRLWFTTLPAHCMGLLPKQATRACQPWHAELAALPMQRSTRCHTLVMMLLEIAGSHVSCLYMQIMYVAYTHSTAHLSPAQPSTAQQHSTVQHSTAHHSPAQHSTSQPSTAQPSTAQHSTSQPSTAQHSTPFAQHSTALKSTA